MLKTSTWILVLSLVCGTLFAQDQTGIQFETGTLKEALAKAEKEGKLVFLDGYASWCGPCKKLMKETFPDKAVGEFYNKNFVNIKIDMEKGEGPEVAEKYGIDRYPTLYFLDAKGNPLHKSMGFKNPQVFLMFGESGKDPDQQYFTLKNRYEKGEKDADLFYNLTMSAFNAFDQDLSAKVLDKFYAEFGKKKKYRSQIRNLTVTTNPDPNGPAFMDMLMNKDSFIKEFGEKRVNKRISSVLTNQVYKASKDHDHDAFNATLEMVDNNYAVEEAKPIKANLQMLFYQNTDHWNDYANVAMEAVPAFHIENGNKLNEVAWNFYEHIDDPKQLEQALCWAKKSVTLEETYYNSDTYAALLYKTNQYDEGLTYVQKAAKYALEDGTIPVETFNLALNGALNDHEPSLRYMMGRVDEYQTEEGEEVTLSKFSKVLSHHAFNAGKDKKEAKLNDLLGLTRQSFPNQQNMMTAKLSMNYYQGAGEWKKFKAIAEAFCDADGQEDWYMLNYAAWEYYLQEKGNERDLSKALTWAKKSVELNENYYNLDTYAALLYATGDYKGANETAGKAIQLAKESDLPFEETVQLMKQIKNKLK